VRPENIVTALTDIQEGQGGAFFTPAAYEVLQTCGDKTWQYLFPEEKIEGTFFIFEPRREKEVSIHRLPGGREYFSDGGTDGVLQPQRFVFRGMDVTMDFNSVAHGTLLGFVHIKGNRIPMIFVEEGARQSGIGSLLLITALREIKAAGFSESSLRSMNDKFYKGDGTTKGAHFYLRQYLPEIEIQEYNPPEFHTFTEFSYIVSHASLKIPSAGRVNEDGGCDTCETTPKKIGFLKVVRYKADVIQYMGSRYNLGLGLDSLGVFHIFIDLAGALMFSADIGTDDDVALETFFYYRLSPDAVNKLLEAQDGPGSDTTAREMVWRVSRSFAYDGGRQEALAEDYIRRLLPRFGCHEVSSLNIIKGRLPTSHDDLTTYVVEANYADRPIKLVLKEAHGYSYESYAPLILENFLLATPVIIGFYRPYYILKYVGDIDLADIYLSHQQYLQNRLFVEWLAYLLGRSAYAAYIIGLGDRNASNIRLDLRDGLPQQAYNVDFVSAFTITCPYDLKEQLRLGNELEQNIANPDIQKIARQYFIQGFIDSARRLKNDTEKGILPLQREILNNKFGKMAMEKFLQNRKN